MSFSVFVNKPGSHLNGRCVVSGHPDQIGALQEARHQGFVLSELDAREVKDELVPAQPVDTQAVDQANALNSKAAIDARFAPKVSPPTSHPTEAAPTEAGESGVSADTTDSPASLSADTSEMSDAELDELTNPEPQPVDAEGNLIPTPDAIESDEHE